MKDEYLGDGVYASYDGYYITLDLRAQDSATRISLDSIVLIALDNYRAGIRAENLEIEKFVNSTVKKNQDSV